jgi:25S rRNA (cytosine2278-C5)-methyltransferase
MEALKEYVDSSVGGAAGSRPSHPRWIRVNTLKTQLEDQLETTFSEFERAATIKEFWGDGAKRIYIDEHVPNLVAIPASIDLTKSEAYTTGAIIFQDKASCFPAYMLDPLPDDGDIVDTCAAPGNKTSHLAAILSSRADDLEDGIQKIHAFERDKVRAETLKKMMSAADCRNFIKIHAGEDFLRVDPNAPTWKNVGALLLDPSCSGSGIVGRDDMPELHLPSTEPATSQTSNRNRKTRQQKKVSLKRKQSGNRNEEAAAAKDPFDITDDDGFITPAATPNDLQARLSALSTFQLSLLLHAFSFPSAHKVTYSTCSIHATENEDVVLKALVSELAQNRGWRLLRREEQVRGLRDWPIRGLKEACGDADGVADACIRANKDDEFGTIGFFLAGFVREKRVDNGDDVLRDEKGFIVRDPMGIPVRVPRGTDGVTKYEYEDTAEVDGEEWNGFSDDEGRVHEQTQYQGREQEPVQTPETESKTLATPSNLEAILENRRPTKRRKQKPGKGRSR